MKGLYRLSLRTVGSPRGALPNAAELLPKGEEPRQMAGLGSPVSCDLDTQDAAPICLDFWFLCKRLVFM